VLKHLFHDYILVRNILLFGPYVTSWVDS